MSVFRTLTSGCSHIHVSLRNADGHNIFALSDQEAKSGRPGAANDDVKYMSQEGEWFLGGVLEGLADGTWCHLSFYSKPNWQSSYANGTIAALSSRRR
jgi:glutamine synthetase